MAENGEEKKKPQEAEAQGGAAPEVDLSKKHPLEHTWTLWFDNPSGKQKQTYWGQTLRSVYTFSTVEDFWSLYNNILQPSRLTHGTDFHLFKEGIEPKWEDPRCSKGGKWNYVMSKDKSRNHVDQCWLDLLLSLIGEQFSEPSEICGGVVNIRVKGDRLALWTRTASKEQEQLALGKEFKNTLGLDDSVRIGYIVHEDALKQDKNVKERLNV